MDKVLESLLARYSSQRRPIEVDFRDMGSAFPYAGDRATHYIHPYPAKLLPHIPYVFLNSELFSKKQDVVLDPFCGSGTVLLEAAIAGRRPVGADCNPLARLISRVKTSAIDPRRVRLALYRVLEYAKCNRADDIPDVVNIQQWFYPHVIHQLSALRSAIWKLNRSPTRAFLEVALSAIVKKVSLADPKVSVPVKLNPERYPLHQTSYQKARKRLLELRKVNVMDLFEKVTESNLCRLANLRALIGTWKETELYNDARTLSCPIEGKELSNNSVQLIITSPPYVSAQKYVRSTSLSLGWLSMVASDRLRDVERKTIGREHLAASERSGDVISGIPKADRMIKKIHGISESRAYITATYLSEMREAIIEMARVLKPGGFFVLVAGNNRICGQDFETRRHLTHLASVQGLSVQLELVDNIKSRGLMTKRNKTASMITREWVTVFKKN